MLPAGVFPYVRGIGTIKDGLYCNGPPLPLCHPRLCIPCPHGAQEEGADGVPVDLVFTVANGGSDAAGTIKQLSGGQQALLGTRGLAASSLARAALTPSAPGPVLSYLFAVAKLRPAPFYVLDEVDAALDDRNRVLVNQLIQDAFPASQVLVVSHHKVSGRPGDC